jgi:hypothetical protein
MSLGSYARFGLGILLSLEVARSYFAGAPSVLALLLAIIFLALAALWVAFRW